MLRSTVFRRELCAIVNKVTLFKKNNMKNLKEIFIQAIHNKVKLRITYYASKYDSQITRLCAPMDFAPSSRAKDKSDKFHFWDYESENGKHTTSKLPEDVFDIEITDIIFDPSDFITWTPNWTVDRDWGEFS